LRKKKTTSKTQTLDWDSKLRFSPPKIPLLKKHNYMAQKNFKLEEVIARNEEKDDFQKRNFELGLELRMPLFFHQNFLL